MCEVRRINIILKKFLKIICGIYCVVGKILLNCRVLRSSLSMLRNSRENTAQSFLIFSSLIFLIYSIIFFVPLNASLLVQHQVS